MASKDVGYFQEKKIAYDNPFLAPESTRNHFIDLLATLISGCIPL